MHQRATNTGSRFAARLRDISFVDALFRSAVSSYAAVLEQASGRHAGCVLLCPCPLPTMNKVGVLPDDAVQGEELDDEASPPPRTALQNCAHHTFSLLSEPDYKTGNFPSGACVFFTGFDYCVVK